MATSRECVVKLVQTVGGPTGFRLQFIWEQMDLGNGHALYTVYEISVTSGQASLILEGLEIEPI